MQRASLPSGVSFTAIQVAGEREREAARADALFSDPLAGATTAYVRETAGPDEPAPYMTPDMQWLYGDFFAIRTRFIDERMLSAFHDGVTQVVFLAAGMDGRAYRLDWPAGVRVFEFDRPEMIAFKQEVVRHAGLSPKVEVTAIPGDLNEDWPPLLRAAGFSADQPTVWVVEGLLAYFSPEAANRLLSHVAAQSAPSSRLLTDYVKGDHLVPAAQAGRDTGAAMAVLATLFRTGPSADPWTWMSGQDWDIDVTIGAECARALNRPVPPAVDPELNGAVSYLVDARRL